MTKKFKTFKDLEFRPHSAGGTAKIAHMEFGPGIWISVLSGQPHSPVLQFYTGPRSYEIEFRSSPVRPFRVRGWVTPARITRTMRYLQRQEAQ